MKISNLSDLLSNYVIRRDVLIGGALGAGVEVGHYFGVVGTMHFGLAAFLIGASIIGFRWLSPYNLKALSGFSVAKQLELIERNTSITLADNPQLKEELLATIVVCIKLDQILAKIDDKKYSSYESARAYSELNSLISTYLAPSVYAYIQAVNKKVHSKELAKDFLDQVLLIQAAVEKIEGSFQKNELQESVNRRKSLESFIKLSSTLDQ